MSGLRLPDPGWLAQRRLAADQPPRIGRHPLFWGPHAIGSIEPDFAHQIRLKSPSDKDLLLQETEHQGQAAWRLRDGPGDGLGQLAQQLREISPYVRRQWRDEALAVWGPDGAPLGAVERGAVRPLGIATQAVHLVGRSRSGGFWVQQRALDKANDPGLWDTLMGGMVSAQDTVQSALARETWEEAGLRLDALGGLQRGGRVTLRRPTGAGTAGYMVEHIDWYQAWLPDGLEPENQDGEVAGFDLLAPEALVARLEQDAFTLEASLILAAALG
ncbi:MAG: NUDIX domain-containing protein [Rhodoferax sp.]|nr:NUDIX domain-containing protein [Rhodoferax sp.]